MCKNSDYFAAPRRKPCGHGWLYAAFGHLLLRNKSPRHYLSFQKQSGIIGLIWKMATGIKRLNIGPEPTLCPHSRFNPPWLRRHLHPKRFHGNHTSGILHRIGTHDQRLRPPGVVHTLYHTTDRPFTASEHPRRCFRRSVSFRYNPPGSDGIQAERDILPTTYHEHHSNGRHDSRQPPSAPFPP